MKLKTVAFLYSLLLVSLLSVLLLAYREFISLPQITQALEAYQKRELSTLHHIIDEQLSFLSTLNYDYAVWTSTYDFFHTYDEEYLEENYLEDTFTTLKIDGVIFYKTDGTVYWNMGMDFRTGEPIDWLAASHQLNTPAQVIPAVSQGDQVNIKTGFARTREGVVYFSTTEVRRSDRSGETPGFLTFIRKVRPELIDQVSRIAQVRLEVRDEVPKDSALLIPLDDLLAHESYQPFRYRYLRSFDGMPVLWLKIYHNTREFPQLLDQRTVITLAFMVLLPFLFVYFANQYLLSPIQLLERHIRRLLKGRQVSEVTVTSQITEISNLVDHFNHLMLKLKAYHASLMAMSNTDQLTGIPNRRAFEVFANRAWNRMRRHHRPMGMVIIDVDYFKRYNDTRGHAEGDKVLQAVARAIHQRISRADDLVARFGGEEFVIVLENSSADDLENVCRLVLETVRSLALPHPDSDAADIVTVSVGAALFSDFGCASLTGNYETLFKRADNALYLAKAAGRNCYRIANSQVS